MTDAAIRPAATIILLRGDAVLMGQRGASAVFMPDKYVFPGGAVDPADPASTALLTPTCAHRLAQFVPPDAPTPGTLARAALRELLEETGLALTPDATLRFVFRAITPPGRTRRFDARFFLGRAADIIGNPDDFSDAEDELSHLHWVPLTQARALDLPFITEVVLAEITALTQGHDQPGVPFFDNSGDVPTFRRIA